MPWPTSTRLSASVRFRVWAAPRLTSTSKSLVNYNAAAIYEGDPVVPLADGSICGGDPDFGCYGCSASRASSKAANTFPSRRSAPSGQTIGPAAMSRLAMSVTAQVINDPHAHFIAQSDATGLRPGRRQFVDRLSTSAPGIRPTASPALSSTARRSAPRSIRSS